MIVSGSFKALVFLTLHTALISLLSQSYGLRYQVQQANFHTDRKFSINAGRLRVSHPKGSNYLGTYIWCRKRTAKF